METLYIKIDKLPLPDSVGGACTKVEENSYQVIINSDKDSEDQLKAFLHECVHIWSGDLEADTADINALEEDRHAQTDKLYNTIKGK